MNIFKWILVFALNQAYAANLPDWVKEVGPCSPLEICVIGSGKSLKEATADSKAEMAKYFETKVSAKTEVINSSTSVGLSMSGQSFNEWTAKDIKVSTEEVLSGLSQKNAAEVNGEFYVLLALNKAAMAKSLSEKIEKIDLENQLLFEKNNRFALPFIIQQFSDRKFLNDRYNLVSNMEITPKVSEADVLKRISNLAPMNIALVSDKQKLPAEISASLEKILSPLNIILVSTKNPFEYKMKAKWMMNDEYFKVEGFKKTTYILKLELQNKQGNTVGRIASSTTVVSRNKDKGLKEAIDFFEKDIRKNIVQFK